MNLALAVYLEGADPADRARFIRDLESHGRDLLARVNPEELRGDWGATREAKAGVENVMAMFTGKR
jgi:hypothetical protein